MVYWSESFLSNIAPASNQSICAIIFLNLSKENEVEWDSFNAMQPWIKEIKPCYNWYREDFHNLSWVKSFVQACMHADTQKRKTNSNPMVPVIILF